MNERISCEKSDVLIIETIYGYDIKMYCDIEDGVVYEIIKDEEILDIDYRSLGELFLEFYRRNDNYKK